MPLRFEIDQADGGAVRQLEQGGPWEVWVVGVPVDHDGQPVEFENLVTFAVGAQTQRRALRLAQLLQPALDELNHTLAFAALLGGLEPRGRDDGHRHKLELARFNRERPVVTVCVECNTTFHELDPGDVERLTAEAAEAGYGDLRSWLIAEVNEDLNG